MYLLQYSTKCFDPNLSGGWQGSRLKTGCYMLAQVRVRCHPVKRCEPAVHLLGKYSKIVTGYACEIMSRASGRTYIFSYFSLISPYFSLLFALLFGTTSPYFFLTFCWKAGGSPDNALPQTLNMVTQLVICEFLRISQFLLFVVFHSNDCAAIYELGGHVKRIDHGWFCIHYFHENRTLCWTFLGFEFVRIRNYCVTSLYIFTVLLLFLYQYVTMLKY